MLVANARMYAVTPAAKAAWQDLFAWVARTSGVPLTYLDHAAPAPLEDLWSRGDLGAAFMCGFPFASAAPRPIALAAPVPSPARYCGIACYCTDFIVRADSPFETLRDTFGRRIGWTVGHSQSGYNAVRHHLLGTQAHFAAWIGPLVTPRRVIEAVLDDTIDLGPIDSYVHELIRRHDPATAAKLRVIDSTAMTPIPLLVASRDVRADEISRLRSAVLGCHAAPEMAPTRETLLLARFAEVDPAGYDMLLAQKIKSDAGGIPAPA